MRLNTPTTGRSSSPMSALRPSRTAGGAGLNVEQCGPHYFDISAEFIFWQRDTLGSRVVPLTSDGFETTLEATNIVQSTDSIDPEFEPGFRIFGRMDLG